MAVAVSFDEFARELREFSDSNAIVNEVRRDLRKPLPALRKSIRESAKKTLPSTGGFGAWVAKASLTVRLRTVGRTAGIKLKLSRKSTKDKADLKALDDSGALRHPLFGNRKFWYPQTTTPGFFTDPWEDSADDWYKVADDAIDRAFDKIRRG